MNVNLLKPKPVVQTQFAWSHHATVPEKPGCYVLATYNGEVLYVGLATKSVRSRMGEHLKTPLKRKGALIGVPFWFHYVLCPAEKVGSIEQGWMNQAILDGGSLPPLNRVASPA